MSDVEIERSLVLSTGHITKEASEYLTHVKTEEGLIVDSYEYGWRVYCGADAIPGTHEHASITDCMLFARKHGCHYVKLDQDGPLVDELTTYEW